MTRIRPSPSPSSCVFWSMRTRSIGILPGMPPRTRFPTPTTAIRWLRRRRTTMYCSDPLQTAASVPPVLPGSARLRLQPVQHPDDPQPPGITGLIVLHCCVRTGHRLGHHCAAAGLGRRPAGGDGARRELLPQGGGLGGQAASPRCCDLRPRRRDHGDVRRYHRESPNNASSA